MPAARLQAGLATTERLAQEGDAGGRRGGFALQRRADLRRAQLERASAADVRESQVQLGVAGEQHQQRRFEISDRGAVDVPQAERRDDTRPPSRTRFDRQPAATRPCVIIEELASVSGGEQVLVKRSDDCCPACPQVQLTPRMVVPGGAEMPAHRCPCCEAIWRHGIGRWECLGFGRLVQALPIPAGRGQPALMPGSQHERHRGCPRPPAAQPGTHRVAAISQGPPRRRGS